MNSRKPLLQLGLISLLTLANACSQEEAMPPTNGDEAGSALSVEELMKPTACKDCHPGHYREWASSMHAYATKDPVFRAMNARGQEETNNELGTFCVNCHAPLAVSEGLVVEGTDAELDALDPEFASVNCYFCHNIQEIPQSFDNGLGLPANNPFVPARDNIMRGSLKDAVKPPAHDVAYSAFMDGDKLESANFCGPCHDIVTPAPHNFHLERTFEEWKVAAVAQPSEVEEDEQSCNDCHMSGNGGLVAKTDTVEVSYRPAGVHEHLFAGIDVALTDDHPDQELQRRAIECLLEPAVNIAYVQVGPEGEVRVVVETDAGHAFPSGATQDRRVWLEVKVTDRAGNTRYIGQVPEDMSVVDAAALPENRRMAIFFDTLFDENGEETHDFWEAADSERRAIKTPTPGDHSTIVDIPIYNVAAPEESWPARVEVMVYIRPIGRDVIEDLLETKHLTDSGIVDRIPTFPLNGTHVVWDMNEHELGEQVSNATFDQLVCPDHYRCLLGDGTDCPE